MVLAWVAAIGATGLVFGLVAQAAGSALKRSPGLERVIERLGGNGSGAASYLGFVFIVAAGLVAIAVAGQIAAVRNEEADGHLENLLVRPVARWRWLGVRLGIGVGLVVVASALVGIAAWVGASSQHAGIGFGELLKAGLNVAPPAVFVLGIGGLAYGLWPRGAIGVVVRARRLVVPRRGALLDRRLEPMAARHVASAAHHSGAGRQPGLDGGRVARRAGTGRRGRGDPGVRTSRPDRHVRPGAPDRSGAFAP